MTIHWKYLFKDGLFSGLLFCVAIMLGGRINPILFAHDFPDITEREIMGLGLPTPGIYEWTLLFVAVQGVLLWRAYRFLNGLAHKNFGTLYVHLVIWFLLLGWCDLLFLDGLLIGMLNIPFSGVEHLLSADAVAANRSFSFHLGEHFLFYGTYLANLILPAILVGGYLLYLKIKC